MGAVVLGDGGAEGIDGVAYVRGLGCVGDGGSGDYWCPYRQNGKTISECLKDPTMSHATLWEARGSSS